MRNIFALLFALSATFAQAQVGSVASTCIWSGTVADCLPSAGILLRNQRDVRFGEASGSGSNYVAIQAPTTLAGDITLTLPVDDGDANEFLQTDGSGNMSWEPVDAATDITGVLPLANGGTNKNATAVNGGLVWSDADSLEITSAGTAQQWVLSGGAGTPTMSNTTTTAKVIDGTADAVQLTVQGHSTQSSNNIFTVENSGATDLLTVTATEGTDILGTTTNDNACNGCVGEHVVASQAVATNFPSSGQAGDCVNISLTAGDWDVSMVIASNLNGATMTACDIGISSTSGNSFSGLVYGNNLIGCPIPTAANTAGASIPAYRVSLTATTTYYAKVSATYSAGNPQNRCRLSARRVR